MRMTDKEIQDKLKEYRYQRTMETESEDTPCYIDENCLRDVINLFFYGVLIISAWKILSWCVGLIF